jgi:hypothetical protein
VNCLVLAVLAGHDRRPRSILDEQTQPGTSAPAAPQPIAPPVAPAAPAAPAPAPQPIAPPTQ